MSAAIRPICLTFVLGLVACAPSPADICSRFAEDCGWDNATCVDNLEDDQIAADQAGCDAEGDEYTSCLGDADTSVCQEVNVIAFCGQEHANLINCVASAPSEP